MNAFSSRRLSIRSRHGRTTSSGDSSPVGDPRRDFGDRRHSGPLPSAVAGPGRFDVRASPSSNRSASRRAAVDFASPWSSGSRAGKSRCRASSIVVRSQSDRHQKLSVPRTVIGTVRKRCVTGSSSVFHANLTAIWTPSGPDEQAAAAFSEDAIAVLPIRGDPSDTTDDECLAAESPAGRTVHHEETDARIVRARAGERVRRRCARASEVDLDHRQFFDAAAQTERRPGA